MHAYNNGIYLLPFRAPTPQIFHSGYQVKMREEKNTDLLPHLPTKLKLPLHYKLPTKLAFQILLNKVQSPYKSSPLLHENEFNLSVALSVSA